MAPVDGVQVTPINFGNFELLCSLSANDVIPVHKYRSNQTGLTVVIAEVEGPVVNGYFCLGIKTFTYFYFTPINPSLLKTL
jgi:hypothetical protein